MQVERLGPIITPDTHPIDRHEHQWAVVGPVPDRVDEPLGRYYLYFADHTGSDVALAELSGV